MKRVSSWALQHVIAARIIIILCYALLNLTGWLTGGLLFSINVLLTPSFFYMTTLVVVITFVIYPVKTKKLSYKNFYLRRKASDFLFITATFLFIVYSSNSYHSGQSVNPLNTALGISIPRHTTNYRVTTGIRKKDHPEIKKEEKKKLRSFIKGIRKNLRKSPEGNKTVVIALLVIAALFLILLISALACSIICAGAEALGYIVLLLGIAAIIFGLVKLIQRIKRGPPENKKPVPVAE